jgi:predicted phage terminase large subunit-like protein
MNEVKKVGILSAGEKAEREMAYRHLIDFTCYMNSYYERAVHVEYLASRLERVEEYIRTEGESGCGRLIVEMPPQEGKSELISRNLPAWVLGRNPDKKIIQTSYGADLAFDESKAIRDYILSERYKAVFGSLADIDGLPVEIAADSKSQSHWDLAAPHRGGLVAAGIGGGITGRGGHLINIDDPIKKPEEAVDKEFIKKLMKWYRTVIYTRRRKGTAIIVTHTRWAMGDFAGELLKKMVSGLKGADQWEVVFLPAVALDEDQYPKDIEEQRKLMARGVYIPVGGDQLGRKPGEPLWPSQFNKEWLEATKAEQGTDWWSLYQQIPGEMIGGFFLQSDFIIEDRDKLPAGMQWYRYIDLALGRSDKSDWNACIAIGHHQPTGDIWGRDMIRIRELNQFLQTIIEWMLSPDERGTIWGVEDVSFQTLVFQEFMKDPRLIGIPITQVKPVGDKRTRALPVQTRARQGHYKLVDGDWVPGYIDEAIGFLGSGHDDQVDTTSGGYVMAAVPKFTSLSFAVARPSEAEGVGYGITG